MEPRERRAGAGRTRAMINRLISWSLHNRFLVISAFLVMCAWGVVALRTVSAL